MGGLEDVRGALDRPAMRLFLAAAALASVAFFGVHVWAMLRVAEIDAELSSVPMARTPPPEVRADGFVPIVDARLREQLGDPAEVVYDAWSEPRPFDFGTFRGWAVLFSFRASGGRALCRCDGTRVAIVTDAWVDSIVTEADLREVAGDRADPFLADSTTVAEPRP
jgi:hypothetical protein